MVFFFQKKFVLDAVGLSSDKCRKCRKPGSDFVQCDHCHFWLHFDCAGFDRKMHQDNKPFYCTKDEKKLQFIDEKQKKKQAYLVQ